MLQHGTILVTGANGGLGNAIVTNIINQQDLCTKYYGIYAVRDTVRGATTVRRTLERAKSMKHDHELLSIDLGSLESVRNSARDINARVANGTLPPIRALVLNAGWGEQITHSFTKDGFDMSFQVNYLSHFLLTLLLLQSMDKERGRIEVLGSWTHDTTNPKNKKGPSAAMYTPKKYQQIFNNPINTEDLAKGKWSSEKEHPGDLNAGLRRYGAAKLCEIMMFRELSRRIKNDSELSGISVVAVDPGAMPSELNRRSIRVMYLLMRFVLPFLAPLAVWIQPNGAIRTTTKSARDVLRAAFDTANLGEHPNGMYFNGSEFSDVGPEAKDVRKSGILWRDSLRYAQVEEGDTVLEEWQ